MARALAIVALLLASCSSDSKPTEVVLPGLETLEVLALAGQVLAQGGEALEGVEVRDETGASTLTDAEGRFLLVDLQPAPPFDPPVVELVVDGGTAQVPGRRFPRIELAVRLSAPLSELGRPIVLPDLADGSTGRQLVALDANGASQVAIDVTGAVSGLALEGELETIVRRVQDAREVELSVGPVATEDLPAPLPQGNFNLAAAFVGPESARFDPPLTLRLPNTFDLAAGRSVQLLHFDGQLQEWVARPDRDSASVLAGAPEALSAVNSAVRGGWYAAVLPSEESCETTVVGQIVDSADGTPLEGVFVAISTSQSTVTDQAGNFRFEHAAAVDFAQFLDSGQCVTTPIQFRVNTPIQFGGVSVAGALAADQVVLGGETELFEGGVLEIEVSALGGVAGVLEGPLALGGEGTPPNPVSVVRLVDDQFVRSVLPGPDGTFQIMDLEPDAYIASYRFAGDEQHGETLFESGPAFVTLISIRQPDAQDNVAAPENLTYGVPALTATLDVPIAATKPSVQAAVDFFRVVPQLPAGLALDTFSGEISGTPTALSDPTEFTITATNGVGSTTTTLTIAVLPQPPANLSYSEPVAIYQVGTPIADNIPSVAGTVDVFTIEPDLPAGLELDSGSGVLSGTPTEESAASAFEVTAVNAGGSATAMLELTVLPLPRTQLAYSEPQADYRVGLPITPNVPSVTGDVDLFTIAPDLPAGLDFDPLTGILSGTPSEDIERTTFEVTAENAGGSTTAELILRVLPASLASLSSPQYSTGALGNPDDFTLGDFDGDGLVDLVAVGGPSRAQPVLLLGKGDGTFDAGPELPSVAGVFEDVATGDFNGDGHLDLVITRNGASTAVFLGQGDATFQSPKFVAINEFSEGLTVDDYNQDGQLDLAVAQDGKGGSTISVTRGDGAGNFAIHQVLPLSGGAGALASGDLDLDGDIDLAILLSQTFTGSAAAFPNLGDGSFGEALDIATGDFPTGIAIGDLTQDGRPDVAVSDRFGSAAGKFGGFGGEVAVHPSEGTFGFASPIPIDTVAGVDRIAIGDLNGDGLSDLAVGTRFSAEVTLILARQGAALFETPVLVGTDFGPRFLEIADVDLDGSGDIVVLNDFTSIEDFSTHGSVLLGGTSGLPEGIRRTDVAGSTVALAHGDFNADTHPDVVALNKGSGQLTLLAGEGDGEFATSFLQVDSGASDVVLADLDLDGTLDLAISSDFGGVFTFAGDGNGNFAGPQVEESSGSLQELVAGDFNGDGFPDLMAGDLYSNDVLFFESAAPGEFSNSVRFPAGGVSLSLTAADLNQDGELDLAAVNSFQGAGRIAILRGDGNGSFSAPDLLPADLGANPGTVAAGDLNLDGRNDLVATGRNDNRIAIYLAIGAGLFDPAQILAGEERPERVLVRDVNLDGLPDLAVGDFDARNVAIFSGAGDGTFNARTSFAAGANPQDFVLLDLNGDGSKDLAVGNFFESTVTVNLGR